MKMSRDNYKASGATLSLAIVLAGVLVLIGAGLFYIAQFLSGDKQIVNATDAGALAAARQIVFVTLTPAQVKQLPQEFTALGVDPQGNICPNGTYGSKSPALFNIIAYDNCAAYTLEIAFKAAADGSPAAITNANTVIMNLNTFANQLTVNIQTAATGVTSSSPAGAIASAATNFMSRNSTNNLPTPFFGVSSDATTLVPNSLKPGYYVNSSPHSNEYFPAAFLAQYPAAQYPQFTNWVNNVVSTASSPAGSNGSNLIKAGMPFDINKITGIKGKNSFVDANGKDLIIALVPFETQQLTHLVSIESTSNNFSTTPPNTSSTISTYSLPPNAVYMEGQVDKVTKGVSRDLVTASAAVVNTPIVQPANISPGYVAIINGGDYVTAMNNAGWTATAIQALYASAGLPGYFNNQNITNTTNIAFDDSKTDIFDRYNNIAYAQQTGAQPYYGPGAIYAGLTSNFGFGTTPSNFFVSSPASAFYHYNAGNNGAVEYVPQHNYNDVVDKSALDPASPSVPFISTLAPVNSFGSSTEETYAMIAFEQWIAYNNSVGPDALGRDPYKDPLIFSGGSPALFKTKPSAPVPGTIIRAGSQPGQAMTIADALKIMGVEVLDGQCLTGFPGSTDTAAGDPIGPADSGRWIVNLLPVVAGNYGLSYLPTPTGEYRPNGFTAIEYMKALYTTFHGGLGFNTASYGGVFPEIPSVYPNFIFPPGPTISPTTPQPGQPCSIVTGTSFGAGLLPAANVSSGLRYFQAFDNSGNRVHYAWPEPPNCPKFETPGTPLQLIQNLAILNMSQINGGLTGTTTVNPNDPYYLGFLNKLLKVMQHMNANITLADLTNVLNSQTIDLNQTLYLIYDSTQPQNDGLEMVSTLPPGVTYQPPDSTQPSAALSVTYSFTSEDATNYADELVNTAAAPNSTITYNGQSVCTAPYGDNEMPIFPNMKYSTYPPFMYPLLNTGIQPNHYVQDSAAFFTSSGANNNNGEVHFFETPTTGNGLSHIPPH